MPLRPYALYRTVIGMVAGALVLALTAVQLASDAFAASAAAPGTFPSRVPIGYALAVYRALDRVAPAPYVETTLAADALAHGDVDAAERYAVRLPSSPVRDELLARVALARGQSQLAREYLLAAPDPPGVDAIVQTIAARDPVAAYELEQLLHARLSRSGTHPDSAARAEWQLGRLANRVAWRQIPGSKVQRAWLQRALRHFEGAVALAPLSERYLVEDANQADLLGERSRAAELFERSVAADPSSADAIAGLGVVAWQNGDRAKAEKHLARARAIDANALMVRALERDLGEVP
jgi:tetratricopeptide (TPR) repeat protein